MIKLTRAPRPIFLTDQKVAELTQEYKNSGTSVWNTENIKAPLLQSSYGKCAYCECPLTIDSNYMEVEHFEDKKSNPEKVLAWENLLPSCKKCNGSKSGHDVTTDPIVDPYTDDPRQHFSFRLYRLSGKSSKGKATIEVVNLNHPTRLVQGRFDIGQKIAELVHTASERLTAWRSAPSTRTRNRLLNIVEGLLGECSPQASYAASAATALLTDSAFIQLVNDLRTEGLWNAHLDILYAKAASIQLETT